jgi:hypothetical protein
MPWPKKIQQQAQQQCNGSTTAFQHIVQPYDSSSDWEAKLSSVESKPDTDTDQPAITDITTVMNHQLPITNILEAPVKGSWKHKKTDQPPVYTGGSCTSEYRKRQATKACAESMKNSKTIFSFFGKVYTVYK